MSAGSVSISDSDSDSSPSRLIAMIGMMGTGETLPELHALLWPLLRLRCRGLRLSTCSVLGFRWFIVRDVVWTVTSISCVWRCFCYRCCCCSQFLLYKYFGMLWGAVLRYTFHVLAVTLLVQRLVSYIKRNPLQSCRQVAAGVRLDCFACCRLCKTNTHTHTSCAIHNHTHKHRGTRRVFHIATDMPPAMLAERGLTNSCSSWLHFNYIICSSLENI